MYEPVPDHGYSRTSSTDRDREIDTVILPIAVFVGAVMLVVCLLGG
jgi:hypothetical protein